MYWSKVGYIIGVVVDIDLSFCVRLVVSVFGEFR